MNGNQLPPIVLCIAGIDPTGGAGLAADIATVLSLGGHPAPVVTAVTVQDTRRVHDYHALPATLIVEQARAILDDMPVGAIKLGMLGEVDIIEAVHTLLRDHPRIPVVLDPVLQAGGGGELAGHGALDALRELLLPLCTLVTPNVPEAYRLAPGADSIDAGGMALLEAGVEYALITGTHARSEAVINRLYGNHGLIERYEWPRLPGEYHGSGCTLASACAALIAQGESPAAAVRRAQSYTWRSLQGAHALGSGQAIPDRLFWARDGGGGH
ncbi:hydroxymethylpyrimidine/phosphomethylpyrimidine kinase [Acidihalobacter yilgarnensis]|uniref:hydroxymethylpyrimidine kinase n=1 Tax=Acidihalobacter yilgarnensis TaxID=2819280 RepID=A0A1D8IRS4_9GAMM|nr:hydroxymethylpyrimidine/phosphomethylpyrimidine kinase [Acidihalobacter yilgarnensis]AOU99044.1 hydroxymethylpyrimidine/phosphomethylpyrimidine kinase [Acidihalobacter yilgarnensis]